MHLGEAILISIFSNATWYRYISTYGRVVYITPASNEPIVQVDCADLEYVDLIDAHEPLPVEFSDDDSDAEHPAESTVCRVELSAYDQRLTRLIVCSSIFGRLVR
jgi:hypothetical protein